jgi:hypothetical protein
VVDFINVIFSYAKDSLYAVVPKVTSIAQDIASTLFDKPKEKCSFTFTERKINIDQSFLGTGEKVANVFHPFRQTDKSRKVSTRSSMCFGGFHYQRFGQR